MKVAVVGAKGQLGNQLVERLDHETLGLDLPEFDITDRATVVERLTEIHPDVVVNAAAYTQVERAEAEPERARAVNVDGVAHLAEACRGLDVALVQISTDYVFGGDAGRTTPYGEADPPAPLNVYGATKLAGERAAAAWKKHLIVRTCGLYGPGAPRSAGHFVDTMLRLADTGQTIRVVDDQECTPSYTPHVARAIGSLIDLRIFGLCHVTNRGATSWHGFAAELFRLAGVGVELSPIGSEEYSSAVRRPRYSVLDTSRYAGLPEVFPMPEWREALAEHVRREGG